MTTPIDTATREEVAGLLKIARAVEAGHFVTPSLELAIHHLAARLQAETARADEAEKERDEAVNWSWVVDRHGTDRFDDLAESWLALEGVQRMHNAVSSVFSKWANDELLTRFKRHMDSIMQQAFVEGCLVGVRAEAVKSAATEQASEARNTELEARAEVLEAENAVLRGRGGPARACTHSICPLGWGRCADAWGRTEMFEDCPALLESLTQHPTRSEGSSSETRPQSASPPELQAPSPAGKED